jgi:hypothetical protein
MSGALVFSGCSKTLNVADLEIEQDLKDVGEAETLQTVTDVTCPDEISDPKDGTTFTCELKLDDGSTVTANLKLSESDDGTFQANYEGIE